MSAVIWVVMVGITARVGSPNGPSLRPPTVCMFFFSESLQTFKCFTFQFETDIFQFESDYFQRNQT